MRGLPMFVFRLSSLHLHAMILTFLQVVAFICGLLHYGFCTSRVPEEGNAWNTRCVYLVVSYPLSIFIK